MKIKKQCLVCNNFFEPCDCENEALGWRKVVCCKEHFLYLLPVIEYTRKQKSKEEARQELSCLPPIEYNDNTKKVVDEIMEEDIPEEKQTEKLETRTFNKNINKKFKKKR